MLMEERWLPIVCLDGWYDVSDVGRVRSWVANRGRSSGGRPRATSPRIMGQTNRKGYLTVIVRSGTRSLTMPVHRLVLEAFVGPCPLGTEACHNNGVSTDNRACNLRWGTRLENGRDKVMHGTSVRGERHHKARLTEPGVRLVRYLSAIHSVTRTDLAAWFDVTSACIDHCVNGVSWAHVPMMKTCS